MSNAGDQDPEILLVEIVGNASKVAPEHIGLIELKVGVTFGLTVITNVVVFAHRPVVGVNVYEVVLVLSNAGDQVPVMLLSDVVVKALNVAPEHIGLTEVNVGVTFELTVITNVAVFAHRPVVGVNV